MDGFSSGFFLNNGLSSNGFVFNDSVFSVNKSDLNTFFLDNGLNDRLVYVFVGRQRNLSGVDKSFDLGRSVNRFQSFFHISSFDNVELFGDFFHSGFDDVLIVDNVSVKSHGSLSLFVRGLDGLGFFSFNNSVAFLNKLRHELFNLLVDSGSDYDSLSERFDLIFFNNSGLSHNSFGDDFGFGRISLGDYFWLHGNVFGFLSGGFEIGVCELNLL